MKTFQLKKYSLIITILFLRPKNLLYLYGSTKNLFIKRVCARRLHRWGISISRGAIISPEAVFPHPQNIVIGRGVEIEPEAVIYQGVTLGLRDGMEQVPEEQIYDYYPHICSRAVIYANSVLVGNICIGSKAVVGANSFVNQDVPPETTVVGIPARKN